MATTPEEFREKLAALRLEYLRSLPEKLGEIESGWSNLIRANWDAESLRQLHRQVHSLVGSGATFGHPALSQSARALEEVLKTLTGQARPANPAIADKVENLLMELRQAVLDANRESPLPDDSEETRPTAAAQQPDIQKQVFLVEDDEMLARDMALQLGHFGYSVTTFHTLADLKRALTDSASKAVIMDIVMPDGDGALALRDFFRGGMAEVPAVFVTCQPDFESRLRAVQAGAKAYLVKPVDIGELVDKLDRLIGIDQPPPFRILIIDDSPVLAEYYALILRQAGMLTQTVTDPMQAMTALEEFNADLILMDVYMPGCDGFELAAVLRQQNAYMSIPIVFLSSETDLDKQLQALGTGADDFLTKPITPHHLISAVSSRAQRARELRTLMLHDSLTGLLNHSTAKERIDKELAQAIRHKIPVAVAMVDIDQFKSINDQHGHLAGDRVIKSLARLFQQRLRKSDIIGRYGGEEFLIMLYDTQPQTAHNLLDRLRQDFAELRHQSGDKLFRSTFSCGIATASSNMTASALTETADRALYQAKKNGRNQVVLVAV